jgi:hypothetical protein
MKSLFFCILNLISTGLYSTIYTVNSLATTSTGSGTSGTLRWCITQANASAGPHTINFSVAGSIAINSASVALPDLVQEITIDGSTAPGYISSPVVFVDGTGSTVISGLTISAANCKIYGLEIWGFPLSGIRISTDLADNFTIGALNKGNVIRGNTQYGITNEGGDNGNIQYNHIGTNSTGTACSTNGYDGILLNNFSNSNSILYNLISCNTGSSIQITNSSSNNVVQGNTIGPLLNSCSNNTFRGIKIEGGASNNIIGGSASNQANKITGLNFWAIEVVGSTTVGNRISGNIMNCNGLGGINLLLSGNAGYAAPTITSASATVASGTSQPNATIEIFRNQVLSSINCSTPPTTTNGQGTDYLGSTTADAAGNWALSGAFSGILVATATSTTGNTSTFSSPRTTSVSAVNNSPCIGLIPLPVSLLSFTVSCTENGLARLYWETASETNNYSFTLKRSINGASFEEIATLSGNLNSTITKMYSYVDAKPVNGEIYYQLSQTDVNGTIRVIGNTVWQSSWCGEQKDTAFVYPNPVTDHATLNIFVNAEDAVLTGGYYDMTGRLVLAIQTNLQAGWNTISTDLSSLQAGNYLLMCRTDQNDKLMRKLIVRQD